MTSCPWRVRHHECPPSPAPHPAALEGIFCAGLSREAASGFQLWLPESREKVTLLGSQGWRAPQATLDLPLLFWQPTQNYWFECVDSKWGLVLQRGLLLTPDRTGIIWEILCSHSLRGSKSRRSSRPGKCQSSPKDRVLSTTGLNAPFICLPTNWPIQSIYAVILSYYHMVMWGLKCFLRMYLSLMYSWVTIFY